MAYSHISPGASGIGARQYQYMWSHTEDKKKCFPTQLLLWIVDCASDACLTKWEGHVLSMPSLPCMVVCCYVLLVTHTSTLSPQPTFSLCDWYNYGKCMKWPTKSHWTRIHKPISAECRRGVNLDTSHSWYAACAAPIFPSCSYCRSDHKYLNSLSIWHTTGKLNSAQWLIGLSQQSASNSSWQMHTSSYQMGIWMGCRLNTPKAFPCCQKEDKTHCFLQGSEASLGA